MGLLGVLPGEVYAHKHSTINTVEHLFVLMMMVAITTIKSNNQIPHILTLHNLRMFSPHVCNTVGVDNCRLRLFTTKGCILCLSYVYVLIETYVVLEIVLIS